MVLIVGALTGFGPLCIDMYLPAYPDLSKEMRASASTVQLTLTATMIGLALGQIVIGPLSDRLGRRRPLFAGLGLFVASSGLCALSQNVETLIALRLAQGLGGSAGIVIAVAVVRDIHSGSQAARFFSFLMLVTGLGPILAPIAGATLLRVGSWRMIFLGLALMGAALLVVAVRSLPETLAVADRVPTSFNHARHDLWHVARSRTFLVNALAGSFGFATIFAYIAGSSFVLQDVYGMSPQQYSLVFGVNAIGLVAGGQLNGYLVSRVSSSQLLTAGLVALSTGAVTFLALVVMSVDGVGWVLATTLLCLISLGFVAPNALALAVNDFPLAAGSASAVLGFTRFSMGALVAPLVGLGGRHSALPLALVMALCALSGLSLRVLFRAPPGHITGSDGTPYRLPVEAALDIAT
jgi:DHA1 family bicyclomycin/chloramphenicol resistance-like MFS transporter